LSASKLPPNLLTPATASPHLAVEPAVSARTLLAAAAIAVLACVVLAASAVTARVSATSVQALPDIEMHLSPLALEGLFLD
jgi:hypothetical protein